MGGLPVTIDKSKQIIYVKSSTSHYLITCLQSFKNPQCITINLSLALSHINLICN